MVLNIDRLYIGLYEKEKVGRVFMYCFEEDFESKRNYAATFMRCDGNCTVDLSTVSFGYAIVVVNFIYNVIKEMVNLGGGLYLENTYELSFGSVDTTLEQLKRGRLRFRGIAFNYTEMNWDRDLPPIPLLAPTSLPL